MSNSVFPRYAIIYFFLSIYLRAAFCFLTSNINCKRCTGSQSKYYYTNLSLRSKVENNDSVSENLTEAERLLSKARELRSEISQQEDKTKPSSNTDITDSPKKVVSKWAVPPEEQIDGSNTVATSNGVDYRLYVDVGRETGTWMDPRWGASGKRIEFSLDVRFLDIPADKETCEQMVKDNFGGKSSPVFSLRTADVARLRSGFDSMKCDGGGYRIDTNGATSTIRFLVRVEGTPENGSSYGDIFVPKGCLYFSIPCFGGKVYQLSMKEGPVTVRQMGWHTGWRREESRIVGIFRAKKTEEAQLRDGF